jgi:hypothetical protein
VAVTTREQIAAMALQGILSRPTLPASPQMAAAFALAHADALLALLAAKAVPTIRPVDPTKTSPERSW